MRPSPFNWQRRMNLDSNFFQENKRIHAPLLKALDQRSTPSLIRLSPRYITKVSSPRNGRAVF